jgi:flagellar basal body-associated protein FliL
MAEEELAEGEEAGKEKKPKKGLPKMVIMILIALIGIIIAVVVAIVVSKKMMEAKKIEIEPIKEKSPVHLPELHTHKLGEFLAKLVSEEEPVYVRIESLALAYKVDYKFLPKELEERQLQMRDIVNDILIASTPEIGLLEGKKAFKEKLLYEFNHILRNGQIEEIYCELILQ